MMKQRRGAARDMSLCALFAALIAAGAFIKIVIPVPVFPMHFTLQWFFVLLAGLTLGARLGGLSVCVYLAVGLAGVPIFAAGGGPAYVIRPTFGFLLGFVLAAYVIGRMSQGLRGAHAMQLVLPSVCGLVVYYVIGMVYFYVVSNYVIGMPVGWKLVLINGCLITVGQDFVLCILAAAVAVRLRPAVASMLAAYPAR